MIVTDAIPRPAESSTTFAGTCSTPNVRVFSDVVPEPDDAVVRAGVEVLERVRPDLVVAVGGGSVLDAAKAMRLFYEHPDLTIRELTLPFLDARKRVADYPQVAHTREARRDPDHGGHRVRGLARPRSSPSATRR